MADTEIVPPIHKNRQTTMGRITGFYRNSGIFGNRSLESKKYGEIVCHDLLEHLPIPFTAHGDWENYSWDDIKNGTWLPAEFGQSFGPTWATHWFHVKFTVPESFVGKEVHFRWYSGTEAMVYDTNGNVLQGISQGFREEYIVGKPWTGTPGTVLEYYVEMACNGMFGEGEGDLIAPTSTNRYYQLTRAEIAVYNRDNFELVTDFDMLYGMADQLSNSHIGYQAMFVANQMVTILRGDGDELEKKAKAKALADAFFYGGTLGSKCHTLYAMGHCHIDSAWLWPYTETKRKCARSFSAQLELMDEYPEYKFVCSSALQFSWIKEYYPSLFDRIKEKVTDKENQQFFPVGAAWIEMDGNLPNGEAFMRQYYYGQKFFEKEFGLDYISKEFWLPDTFGYSAQIPQMLKHCGINRFLTQKMSWSLVNKFPNHNFWWEGIDGSRVMVHFPPGDGYGMNGNVDELLRSENNSLDKGRANCGAFLYGYGDGGGGPTRQMIEKIKRCANVDGMPKVIFGSSNEFFDALEKDSNKFYKWVGELYLELHNGTYTTQARIKWYNRKGEFLFREVELLMSMAYATTKATDQQINEDMATVDDCWKDFLLNQFHDVLPGSCIEIVAQDAWKIHADIFTKLMALRSTYHNRLLGGTGTNQAIYNTLPWQARTVVFMKPDNGAPPSGPNIQAVTLDSEPFEDQIEGRFRVPNQFSAALVDLSPTGYSPFTALEPSKNVSFTAGTGENFGSFSNGIITLEVQIVNGMPKEQLFFDGDNKTPAFNDFNNLGIDPAMFYIYDDQPMYWDAWDVMDYHLETRRLPDYIEKGTPEQFGGNIVGGYKWQATFGNGSIVTRYAIMRAESPMIEYYAIVDWKEDHKFLKVEFPADVLSRDATFEIQYGHAARPTHINTSWDMAKFEVCGHKWMDMSQADKGVTVITDSKYGWHVRENHIQLSLLKSAKNPDKNADMHKHYIYYAVLPHKGTFQGAGAIQRAYEINVLGSNNIPLISTSVAPAALLNKFVTSSNSAAVVAAVKVSKANVSDPTPTMNTLCIRLYEAYGGYADTAVSLGFAAKTVTECNGLEDPLPDGGIEYDTEKNEFKAEFKPFQIRSFLVTF